MSRSHAAEHAIESRVRSRLARARLKRALAPRGRLRHVRIGSAYGGWWVPEGLVTERSVVYSAGVGEDVSFDLGLIGTAGCTVWAFDPTPRAIAFAAGVDEPRFRFEPYGVWCRDETVRFFAPIDPAHVSHTVVSEPGRAESFLAECRTVASLAAELGHDRIDLLKLDIEGAEYDVLPELGDIPVRCICAEFHPVFSPAEIARRILALDYEVTYVDGWNVTMVADA